MTDTESVAPSFDKLHIEFEDRYEDIHSAIEKDLKEILSKLNSEDWLAS
jgi:argininosuccinate lyase